MHIVKEKQAKDLIKRKTCKAMKLQTGLIKNNVAKIGTVIAPWY